MTPGHEMDPALSPSKKLPAIALAALVVCGAAALFWPSGAEQNDSAGYLVDVNGRPAPLGDRLEPVTLVHFWATWCPPCLTEIPAILRLRDELARPGTFAVVLVAVSDSPEKVKPFLGEASDEALFDPRWEVARRYGTQLLPETYVLVDGKVADKFVGATDWDDRAIRQRIEARLPAARLAGSSR